MKVVEIDEKIIYGITVRTTNMNEMDPGTAKIAATWQKFDNQIEVDYQNGERVYGVYYNFESDVNGEFDLLAGYDKKNHSLKKVTIQAGRYLLFRATAKESSDLARVQAVIDCWGDIWQCFDTQAAEYKRAYNTDFEHYRNPTEIDIYISII
ncbi:hypothetical protein MNBD_GAMMA12-942 [hydrothermal vent metagenome]|uniref:AraC effector-binding domain-containing protein n=1 Tax=hydrothermal vent metagenome TaxID=652676 RepID=A0A3B0Z234_9ZZZZ